MLPIGSAAPAFELPDETGAVHRLEDVLRRGPLVLFIYPADFTPVCTRQACMFREAWRGLDHAGVRVLGVSPQGAASHERFSASNRLPFPLLSDPDRRVLRAYGAISAFGLTKRVTYFIDGAGIVRDRVRAGWRISRHEALVDRVLRAVREPSPAQAAADC